jgi:polygalacturonase
MMCERVNIRGIRIIGDQRMINNDGIDIDSCRDVVISDCIISTDDDCLVLRAMQRLHDEPAVCELVTVTNCMLDSTCQGIRIGCPSDATIRNSSFSNIVISSRLNGVVCNHPRQYLAPQCSGRADIQNIMFNNFVIDCGMHPIKIDVEDGIALSRLAGFSFANFRMRSGKPILIKGSPETIIRDVSFSNMTLHAACAEPIICRYCDGLRLDHCNLSVKDGI